MGTDARPPFTFAKSDVLVTILHMVWNLRFNICQHGHIGGFRAYAISTNAHALTRIDNLVLEEERFLLKKGSSSANTVHVIKSVIDF